MPHGLAKWMWLLLVFLLLDFGRIVLRLAVPWWLQLIGVIAVWICICTAANRMFLAHRREVEAEQRR